MNPRIFTYKITFEEVPYYYYGVHKEKIFNEEYCGTPITHKWCWELYTPKKQILQFFEYSDEGWLEANLVEDRLIKPVYQTDKWCLNESCGALISLNSRRKGGKTQAQNNKNMNVGFYGMTKQQRFLASQKGGITQGNRCKETRTGIFSISEDERKIISSKAGKIGSKINKENKVGIFSLTRQQLSENGKIGGKISSKKLNSQKWKCLITGFISTSGPLTNYQKSRNIDPKLREIILL
jgi:hypothetical protein